MTFLPRAQRALAAAGPDAALYGLSAAHLLQLTQEEPETLDVVIPWGGTPPEVPGVRVRRTRGEHRRPLARAPLPHTDIVETVLDLADRTDPETCVFWLTEATRRGLLATPELVAALDERRRHRHRRLINDIAEDLASGVTSNLEVRYARAVERAHRLIPAERQYIVQESGHRADFAYPTAKVLIEVDGLAYHQGAQKEQDRTLDALHAAAGWTTVRYTWGQVVGSPCVLAREVAALVSATGLVCEASPCEAELHAAS